MWFLIKGTFWFSLVLVALSYFGSYNDPTKEPSAFDLPSAVSAAGEAYRYVSAICIEKPGRSLGFVAEIAFDVAHFDSVRVCQIARL